MIALALLLAAADAGTHWAFQPVRKVEGTVDGFVDAALKKAGLRMAPRADSRTLARRLSIVLTGLPPGDELGKMPYADAVEAMLASPHFGERWARHWLDVVRFGENHGYEWNYEIHGAWRYRDYLIRAFNQDVPYDQLTREHIAGDLLAQPRINGKEKFNESVIGTAFFRLGEAGHDDCIEFRSICLDVVDNQIDTLGKAFQGLTIACARCHDHKVDPIPTLDYHAMLGVIGGSRQVIRSIDSPDRFAEWKAKLAGLKAEIRKELAALWMKEAPQVVERLKAKTWDKAAVDDPLYPWITMVRTPERDWAAAWAKMVDLYKTPGAGYTELGGWMGEGVGLERAGSGEFAVATEGEAAVEGVYPAGWYTHLLSDKLDGAMRSPLLGKDKKFVSVLVAGGKLAARRTVVDGGPIGENYDAIKADSPRWVKLPALADEKQLPVWMELVTKTLNPRIPDRPGRLKASKAELESPRSWFGFVRAVTHDADEAPKAETGHIARLFGAGGSFERRYFAVSLAAVEAWASGRGGDDDARWVDWMARSGLLSNSWKATPRLERLITEYRNIEGEMPVPRVVTGMTEGDRGIDYPLFPYGDWKHPGKIVARGYLRLFGSGEAPGRLAMAEKIASAQNPLTARVMVNRIWQHLFGTGIVATADNFGRIGETPSHPELLDYLAGPFVEQGWSVKTLIREIVMSRAFQQSGADSAAGLARDPRNRLLHHYPVRRMEGEAIRDSILAVSGKLDPTLYGESVDPHRETAKDYRRLFSGPLDGKGRRSIYLRVTRMEWDRLLETFDFPAPLVARGSRDVTNVPAQALALMNDPFVIEQAGVWADRVLAGGPSSVDARLEAMTHAALGRDASAKELAGLRELVARLSDEHGGAAREVWRDVAHSLFNLKEFIYVP